jgi:DNA repair protein RecO (recombination protein O)
MAKERTYKTTGIVIRKTKLGEADRILTFFTPDYGKIQGFAKSVRKTNSKLSGHLELLTYSSLTLTKGRGIDTVIGSQNIDSFLNIKNDLYRISYALYMAELIEHFATDEEANPELFDLYLGCMKELGRTPYPLYLLRYFEVNLLTNTGFRPEMDQCVICQTEITRSNHGGFSPSAGGMLCSNCRDHSHYYGYPLSWRTCQLIKDLQKYSWEELENEPPDSSILNETEMLLKRYITFTLEKEVKSYAWLNHLRLLADVK